MKKSVLGAVILMAAVTPFTIKSMRSAAEMSRLQPEIKKLQDQYKNDRVKQNEEMQALFKEHGVNPLGGLVGCLPLVVQLPILTALYYVFQGFAKSAHIPAPFLFIPNLNDNPTHHLLLSGLPIPVLAYLIFPLLAALTTLVQSRMLQMPPAPNPTDQEAQTQQMQRTMVWLSPLMIGYFALNVPAGLGLYWFVGNCVSIIQQSFVVGWGNVLPARFRRTVSGGSNGKGALPPKKGPDAPPKKGPGGGPKSPPGNGVKPKRPKR